MGGDKRDVALRWAIIRDMRLGLQQRVYPLYRRPFFELLGQALGGEFSLFAGLPRPDEGIRSAQELTNGHYFPARNLHLFRGAFYLCYQRNILDWLKTWDPQILIVEANPRYLSTRIAIRWMKARHRPVLGWGLGAPPITGALRVWRQQGRLRFLQQFDGLIAYSRRGVEEYAAAGVPRSRIFLAPNAVAPRPSAPPPARPPIQGRYTVLYVGRLQPRKRVDWLIRACAEMPIPPRLLIVGDGPDRARLEQVAAQHYPQAEFIGEKHGEALAPFFHMADLFVLPGTGGLAIQEAMSYGLPVLVARGDGTQDDLVRPENGWQIPPDDYPALVQTLHLALSDGMQLRQKGEASYRIVRDEINLERMVEAFLEAIQSATSNHQ